MTKLISPMSLMQEEKETAQQCRDHCSRPSFNLHTLSFTGRYTCVVEAVELYILLILAPLLVRLYRLSLANLPPWKRLQDSFPGRLAKVATAQGVSIIRRFQRGSTALRPVFSCEVVMLPRSASIAISQRPSQ